MQTTPTIWKIKKRTAYTQTVYLHIEHMNKQKMSGYCFMIPPPPPWEFLANELLCHIVTAWGLNKYKQGNLVPETAI